MKVKITYYKSTGKWYSDEEFESKLPEGSALHHYWEELEQMFGRNERPGLIDGENEFIVVIEVPGHEHAHPRMILPKGKSLWLCPKCGRDRRVPYDDDGKLVPCCNPKCKGKWGTGCYCCHHPKFLEEEPVEEIPKRQCQALNHMHLPPHDAEVVCSRENSSICSLQWFSCREHAPKDVRTEPIEEWFANSVYKKPIVIKVDANKEMKIGDEIRRLESELVKITEFYEREFDKRTAIRRWWRSNTKIVKGLLTVDDQALADLRELIADHSFDEHMTLGTKDQRILALKEELAERCDRIDGLVAVLENEKLQHEETRGYRQKAEKNLRAVSAALHAYPDSDLESLAKLYYDVYMFRTARCDSGDCETLEMYRASAVCLNDELERLRKPKIDS